MTRSATEEYETQALGLPRPRLVGNVGSTCIPDASVTETQVFTMTLNLVVGAPVGPRAVGDRLYLVFVEGGSGGKTIGWNVIFRDCPTPAAGVVGTRLSVEVRWDGASWQFTGGSTAFA